MHISRSRAFLPLLFGCIFIILESGSCLFPSTSYAASSGPVFSLSPTAAMMSPIDDFSFRGTPGSILWSSVRITNIGDMTGTADLYPVDGITAQKSGVSFPSQTALRHDVGAWIVLKNRHIVLTPGQYQDVPFLIHIPRHTRNGEHGGGILLLPVQTEVDTMRNPHDVTIQMSFVERVGIGILVTLPSQLVANLSSSGVTYDGTAQPYQQLLIHLQNKGNMMLHPSGSLQVWDQQGYLLQNIPLHLSTIMPQDSIAYPAYIHNQALPPGTYHALLQMAYEQNSHLSLSTTFIIPASPHELIPPPVTLATSTIGTILTVSPWYFAIVGAIFLFPLVVILLRRRQAKQKDKISHNPPG